MLKNSEKETLDAVRQKLIKLGIPVHKVGYEQLCVAITRFSEDKRQSITKEVYPDVARMLGCSNGRAVEYSIRDAIKFAWKRRDREVWARYFPDHRRPPSNKRFIATLVEFLR